jgi:hypothetical protein
MLSRLASLVTLSLASLAAGYQIGARAATARRMRGGVASISASAAAPPAEAVSMKAEGLCSKLSVPSELLDKTDVFIFDCDGVIWKGDSLIDGVPATLAMLRDAGKKIFFVTNNSTKSRKGYLAKFLSLGLEGVEPEEIFSSSFAAAAYLEQVLVTSPLSLAHQPWALLSLSHRSIRLRAQTKFKEKGKKVYIIGEVGIEEELDLIGVPWIGGGSDAGKKIELKSGYALPHDEVHHAATAQLLPSHTPLHTPCSHAPSARCRATRSRMLQPPLPPPRDARALRDTAARTPQPHVSRSLSNQP